MATNAAHSAEARSEVAGLPSIFGYGSLIWRPSFEYVRRSVGYIRGWRRLFYQGSTDHRGVPGEPGRVVTLIRDPTATCWGVVYWLPLDKADEILASLDHREKGGYSRAFENVYDLNSEEPIAVNSIVYMASEDNPNYLGPAEASSIGAQIVRSVGPSGPNIEYFMRLVEWTRSVEGAHDVHIEEIAVFVEPHHTPASAHHPAGHTVTTAITTHTVDVHTEPSHHHR